MARLITPNITDHDFDDSTEATEHEQSRSPLLGFYRIERTQYCRGYAYVSFACAFFTFFIFFIKIADCSEESCISNDQEPWNWTLQCLVAVGCVSMICFVMGIIFLQVAKHREKIYGYSAI